MAILGQNKKRYYPKPVDNIFKIAGDPYETRTRVTAVKGRCLNLLTNGPRWVCCQSTAKRHTQRLAFLLYLVQAYSYFRCVVVIVRSVRRVAVNFATARSMVFLGQKKILC